MTAPGAEPAAAGQGPAGLDWPGLMRAALSRPAAGGLGLRPEQFWCLTPAELAVMLALPGAGARPMDRAGLERLLRDWPDHEKGGQDADRGL